MLPDLKIWLNHFEYHAQRRPALPEGIPDHLTEEEKHAIADSIATFQLGEQSSGSALIRAAWRFANQHDASSLVQITELFIREEQHHAALLREFMERHDIPLKQHDWTDRMFRVLRRLSGYELFVSVLVSAELIGYVYYRALEAATDCGRLRLLCRLLVADELAHIGFESEMLLAIRAGRNPLLRAATDLLHRSFITAAAFVVWHTHGSVLARAGYRMTTFLRACRAQYAFYFKSPMIEAPSGTAS